MKQNAMETILGAVVLLVAGFFLWFVYGSADLDAGKGGYAVRAEFPQIDGLKPGSDVRINGVKVGSVLAQSLNTETYMADVVLNVRPDVRLPVDTIAMIANESLLGGRYVALEIGVDDKTIATNGQGIITRTQPPLRIDDLIGRFVFSNDGAAQAADAP